MIAGLGAAALATRSLADPDWMARRLDGSPLDGLIDLGNQYGDGLPLAIGTAGLLATGHLLGDTHLRLAAGDMARSLIWSGVIVWGLKIAVNAERPDGGRHSFPSGHTASAFAIAPVLARHWGWKAALGAFTLATATAMGRMEDRRHHLADVLCGAAIGLAIGYEVTRAGDGGESRGRRGIFDVLSFTSSGLGLSIRF